MVWCVAVFLVPLLLGMSGFGQRLMGRLLKVKSAVWPLVPFDPAVRWPIQVLTRATGLGGTFFLLFLSFFLLALTDEVIIARVKVGEGMAAAAAGVLDGDLVVGVDGAEVDSFEELHRGVLAAKGPIRLAVKRGEALLEIPVVLREGKLGVAASMETRKKTTLQAAQHSLQLLNVPSFFARGLRWAAEAELNPVQGFQTKQANPLMLGGIEFLSFALAISWWVVLMIESLALVVLQRRTHSTAVHSR